MVRFNTRFPHIHDEHFEDYSAIVVSHLETAYTLVRIRTLQCQQREQIYSKTTLHTPENERHLGWVWLASGQIGLSANLQSPHHESYRVVKRESLVNYKVEVPNASLAGRTKAKYTVHVLRMKAFFFRVQETPARAPSPPLAQSAETVSPSTMEYC